MIATKKISFRTKGKTELIDIAQSVADQVSESGINNGSTVFVAGSTAGLTTLNTNRAGCRFSISEADSSGRYADSTTSAG
jgi:thiamine phosphate synthase YjbQ (UPF0047 family)